LLWIQVLSECDAQAPIAVDVLAWLRAQWHYPVLPTANSIAWLTAWLLPAFSARHLQ
jgi:hypothetical protein